MLQEGLRKQRRCGSHGDCLAVLPSRLRDGAFTANDPEVRAYALQKTMRAMDIGAELGAKIFVLWGGREGVETDACRRADEAIKHLREAINYLCEYNIDRRYGMKFALED